MVSIRKRNRSQILISFDPPVSRYSPGEAVRFSVDISLDQDLEVRGGTATLSGHELFRFYEGGPADTADLSDDGPFPWDRKEFFAVSQDFLGPTTLTQGDRHHFELEFALPETALPSFTGDVLGVQWQVSVKLDRPRAADVNADAVLRVVAPVGELLRQPGDFGTSDRPDEAEMTLQLPGTTFRAGDTIEGAVQILPHEDFNAGVRLELVRHEEASEIAAGNERVVVSTELAGPTQFTPGIPLALAWKVAVPADSLPSIRTPGGSVEWTLRAILDRRLRKDVSVSHTLTIYGESLAPTTA